MLILNKSSAHKEKKKKIKKKKKNDDPYFDTTLISLYCFRVSWKENRVIGSQLIACGSIIIVTFIVSFYQIEVGVENTPVSLELFRWIDSESLNVLWVFQFDSLTVSMLIPVLVISCLVHIYSVGYMSQDPHNQRFFSYLSLFTFMMIILVTANNFLLMFVGWEGVGVCSYLLVSFWYAE